MKKYIAPLLCMCVLCSCADTEEAPSSVAETTAATITEASETTTEIITEAPAEEEHGKLFCIYSRTGLTLKMDGVEKNFVELQQVPNAQQTVIADFNFDFIFTSAK